MAKLLLAYPVSLGLYYLGCLACILFERVAERSEGWLSGALFSAYQSLMLASVNVNDWGNATVWTKV